MKAATAKGAARGKVLSRAIQALGAPSGGRALLLGADTALVRALKTDLALRDSIAVDLAAMEAQAEAAFDLVLVAGGIETGGLADIRQTLETATRRLAPGGSLVLYLATLTAPITAAEAEGPVQPYDLLLFPEAAAAGDLGEGLARRTPLAASTWLLLFRSLGLAVAGQAGRGEHRLPVALAYEHQARLRVFDPLELTTGQLLVILRAMEDGR